MRASTRRTLLAVCALLLLLVLAAWYYVTRLPSATVDGLSTIIYRPAAEGAAPYLTFAFSRPLNASWLAGTTARLASFTPAADAPPFAAGLAGLLLRGPPFATQLPAGNPLLVTTNTLPAGADQYVLPLTIPGAGTMVFTKTSAA